MSKVVIFGVLDFAELAHYYLEQDSEHEVVAFTVHQEFLTASTYKGLPVIPFEKLEEVYSPSEFSLFAPMSGRIMNGLRESVYNEGKKKGFNFISYISSKATVLTDDIGENCFILEDNTIQPFVKIGNNVVLWSGNHIGHHSRIHDHVFFTSQVVLSGHCEVFPYCFFGVNSTIRDGLKIAQGTLLAMSSSLVKDSEEWGVYIGNPAKKKESLISKDAL